MKATANGRNYEDTSWAKIVARVILAENLGRGRVLRQEREGAANQLARGITAVVGHVLIKPEGARE